MKTENMEWWEQIGVLLELPILLETWPCGLRPHTLRTAEAMPQWVLCLAWDLAVSTTT